jgi:hypothetical protein
MASKHGSPAVRARSAQDTLTYLESYRPGARVELGARLPKDVLETIASYASSGFVPIEADAKMGNGILELLGREEALRFWTRYATHHLDSPILAGIVRTAFSLFGTTPGSLVKWIPKGLSQVFRDAFDVTVETLDPNQAIVRFDVLSDVFFEAPVYMVVLESIFQAIYVATRTTGEARLSRDPAKRTITVRATWK